MVRVTERKSNRNRHEFNTLVSKAFGKNVKIDEDFRVTDDWEYHSWFKGWEIYRPGISFFGIKLGDDKLIASIGIHNSKSRTWTLGHSNLDPFETDLYPRDLTIEVYSSRDLEACKTFGEEYESSTNKKVTVLRGYTED